MNQMAPTTPLDDKTWRTLTQTSDSSRRPISFVGEDVPVMTPDVAAVLARIVRSMRELQEGEATT
jgi:hypothetical protein